MDPADLPATAGGTDLGASLARLDIRLNDLAPNVRVLCYHPRPQATYNK
jgi:hypothetical protein